jgi:hypothetical protein
MSYARARLANRVAPVLQDESLSETIEAGMKKGLMAAGFEEKTAANTAPWLALLPEFIPGVGGAVGADNTRKHLEKGDYGMAALEGGLTAAGEAFPVIGDLAKWAILAPAAKKFGGTSVENMEEVAHSTLNGPALKPNAIKKVEDNPYGARVRERMQEGNFENVMEEWVDQSTYPVIPPDELADSIVVPISGDPTAVGEMSQYMGIPLNNKVEFDGGVGFGAQNKDDLAWASMYDTADGLVDKIHMLGEKYPNKRIIGAYGRMGDRSPDFNTMPMTLAGELAQTLGSDFDPKLFDAVEAVGETMEGFPGLASPKLGSWLSETSSDNRKALLVPFMNADDARPSGIFGPDILRATIDQNLRDDPIRSMGQLMVELDPSATKATRGVNHNTYDGGVPAKKGGLFGRLDKPVTPEVLLDRAYTDVLKMTEKNGKLIPPSRAYNTVVRSKPDGAGKSQGYAAVEDRIVKGLLGL